RPTTRLCGIPVGLLPASGAGRRQQASAQQATDCVGAHASEAVGPSLRCRLQIANWRDRHTAMTWPPPRERPTRREPTTAAARSVVVMAAHAVPQDLQAIQRIDCRAPRGRTALPRVSTLDGLRSRQYRQDVLGHGCCLHPNLLLSRGITMVMVSTRCLR